MSDHLLLYEISNVLINEAELLDQNKMHEWYEFLTDDIVYEMPIRLNMPRGTEKTYSKDLQHFSENKNTLRYRVDRYDTGFAWAEDPPSRTRRFITNIKILSQPSESEVEVKSYFMLYRNRKNEIDYDLVTGERQDVLRKENGQWKLSKRLILIDQATLNVKNMALFV